MSHPIINPDIDPAPIEVGEVWENPVTGERGRLLEAPWQNSENRLVAELTVLAGGRVVGEHRHPALVERFTVLEGKLTVKVNDQTSILRAGETREIRPREWHDWWNASTVDALIRSEVTPGERFLHMIETLWGLARLGHTDQKGMPNLLQLAMTGREFSDVIQFRRPPWLLQKSMGGLLGLIARPLGYRGTYPEISRSVNAPRPAPRQA